MAEKNEQPFVVTTAFQISNTSASRATFLAGYCYYELGRYSEGSIEAYPFVLAGSFCFAVIVSPLFMITCIHSFICNCFSNSINSVKPLPLLLAGSISLLRLIVVLPMQTSTMQLIREFRLHILLHPTCSVR